ncbi:Hypothetical predicted protein [Paramuricea clavata]|uniref:Uncharacterized protein n=1 Tax=Paramuricea clavata TaxID=317549 RepID=A0A6S7FUI8_PARCT|nr:Hypothetical predicted protein [Paramuricea clavata]
MLEEIIACFLSLFSGLTLDAPRLSRELNDSTSPSNQRTRYTWEDTIHKEYVSFEEDNLPSETEYVQLGYELRNKPSYIQSLLRSLKANFTITLAVLPLALIGIALIYFDLRTVDLCLQWEDKNYTLSFDVRRIRLIGKGFQKVILYLWFPLFLVVLFGWSEFKRHYSSTILVGQLAGLFNTLYLTFLLLYGIHNTRSIKSHDVPAILTFAVATLWESAIVVRNIRIQQNQPTVSYSGRHIFSVLAVPALSTLAMAVFYKYAVVKWFNSLDNVLYQFILAILTPTLALVPTTICRHMALWRTSEIIEPERSFALVYFIRAMFITLYRIMQSDFENIWLFVGLSLLSGVSSLLKTATVGIREKVWVRVIRFLNRTCCARLHHLPGNTPHHRRLKADTEIQNILFENNSLILSQSYIVLYTITKFQVCDWSVVKSSLTRIAIGLVIEFVFNFLSTFIRIHWHNIPIMRVYSKYWKRHVFANIIVVAVLVCYFTNPLVAIFQNRFHDSGAGNYTIRNCTLPYENWR